MLVCVDIALCDPRRPEPDSRRCFGCRRAIYEMKRQRHLACTCEGRVCVRACGGGSERAVCSLRPRRVSSRPPPGYVSCGLWPTHGLLWWPMAYDAPGG
eukprot:5370137-Prymnesium_polylepis.1